MKAVHKKLLTEVAMVAAQHKLTTHAAILMDSLPFLIKEREDLCIYKSLMYFALNQRNEALNTLNNCKSAQAKGLTIIYSNNAKDIDTEKVNTLLEEK